MVFHGPLCFLFSMSLLSLGGLGEVGFWEGFGG